MSREDGTDIGLLALAIASIVAIYLLTHDYLRPLPLHRRAWEQARRTVGL